MPEWVGLHYIQNRHSLVSGREGEVEEKPREEWWGCLCWNSMTMKEPSDRHEWALVSGKWITNWPGCRSIRKQAAWQGVNCFPKSEVIVTLCASMHFGSHLSAPSPLSIQSSLIENLKWFRLQAMFPPSPTSNEVIATNWTQLWPGLL